MDLLNHYGIWAIQDLMFEPLVRYGKNGVMEPCLATEWKLDDGGRKLHFTLREGVVFQDGTKFDASAAKWNLDRWMGTEKFGWMNCSRLFEAVDIVDDHHITIRFKEPVLALLQELSYTRPPRFLSPKSVGPDGKFKEPVGTGPWRQISADDTQSVFERFEDYWGDKPSFKRLEAKVLPDSRSRVSALRAGELDLIGGAWVAALSPIEAANLKGAGFDIAVDPGNVTLVLGFNGDRVPALNDPLVRKAISIGIDRMAISKALYRGFARPAGNLFSDALPLSGKQFEPYARDAAAASALLEKAGWTGSPIRQKDGRPLAIEIVVSDEAVAGARAIAEVMQAQLSEIGIELTIRSADHASKHTEMVERKYDLGLFQTYGAPFEPFGTIVGLFLSTFNNTVEGKLVTDPKNVDPLINAASSASPEGVEQALQAFYDWLHDNDAIAPLVYVPSIWAYSKRVQGFANPATEYDMPYEKIRLTS
jgi:nickel transport system substrate-binding protein